MAVRMTARPGLAPPRDQVAEQEPLFVPLSKSGRLLFDWQDGDADPARRGQVKALSDKAVDRLVHECAAAAGLFRPQNYSGHSLRAGLATSAGEEGAEIHNIMKQTGHRSVDVALQYVRSRDLWKNNVTEMIFQKKGD